MSKPAKLLATILLLIVGSLNVTACEREGPAERAGEEIDEAGRAVGESVEDAGD